jgi:hypothetical protein
MDKRRKELLFLAIGLVVLLAALYLTFKPSARPAQATAQPQAAVAATAAPSTAPQPSAKIESSAGPLPMSEGGTTQGRNPFKPVMAALPAAPPRTSPPPMFMPTRMTALPPISSQPVPLTLFGPGAQPTPGGVTNATPVAAGPPPEPPLRLTGVIYGDPSVAIIRKGDKRYFVRPGDPVGNRYTVQSISHRQVVLASNQGTLSLELTGRL